MLEKKKNFDENNVVTIIGPGTTITGEIESKGTVRVEGTVNGRIDCEDTIVIHESGHVKADLIGGQVIISGTVEGNTFAHDRLEVTNQGKIVGNITAPRISIAEGVIFEGQCTMKPVGQLKPPTKDGKPEKEKVEVAAK
jgi:cytoskeletal protein CcmA (bactofilin family)